MIQENNLYTADTLPAYYKDVQVVTFPFIRKLFVDVFTDITGYGPGNVIVETANDRRPARATYCGLWFKSNEPLGQGVGVYEDIDAELMQIQDNETLMTVQVSIYGNNAYDEALRTMQQMHNQNRYFDLWQVIGFAGLGPLQDISTEIGAKIQQRVYFDFSFYTVFGRKYSVDWFASSQWIVRELTNDHKETWNHP